MSPAGTGSKWYREPILKWLLIYAASPFVVLLGIVIIFIPYVAIVIAVACAAVGALRNHRSAKTAVPRDHRA
jgi:hypothetical protein